MHQNAFGGRAPPEPAGGAYSAPSDTLVELGEGRGVEKGEGKRERKEGKGWTPQCLKCIDANVNSLVIIITVLVLVGVVLILCVGYVLVELDCFYRFIVLLVCAFCVIS